MRHDHPGDTGLDYAPCQYGASRLYFRGPLQDLRNPHIAFLGGTETYGKFIAHPFVALTEERLGTPCVNLGVPNASIDVYIHDPALKEIAQRADFRILQITGAQNISNRFFTVHPRRNDRFVRASSVLQAIYPEVDFSQICFTRHLLSTLWTISPERFAILREELQTAWSARMRSFLISLGPDTLLLWFASHLPSDDQATGEDLGQEPLFVTQAMIDALMPLVAGLVTVRPSTMAQDQRNQGMVYTTLQEEASRDLPGPLAHQEVAMALTDAIKGARSSAGPRRPALQPAPMAHRGASIRSAG